MKFGVIFEDKNSIKELTGKINFYKKEILFLSKNLNNENFINNAPKKIIYEQSEKLKSAKANLKLIETSIKKK